MSTDTTRLDAADLACGDHARIDDREVARVERQFMIENAAPIVTGKVEVDVL